MTVRIQVRANRETARPSKMVVFYHSITQHHKSEDLDVNKFNFCPYWTVWYETPNWNFML